MEQRHQQQTQRMQQNNPAAIRQQSNSPQAAGVAGIINRSFVMFLLSGPRSAFLPWAFLMPDGSSGRSSIGMEHAATVAQSKVSLL